MKVDIAVDDPRADDVRSLLAIHLRFSHTSTPREYSFALDVEQLVDPSVTFFSARDAGRLVGVAALKRLDASDAELKSMHTVEAERGRGVGRALVDHIVAFATSQGYQRLYLETGSTDEFVSARALYDKAGFSSCAPFGDYRASDYNTFMALDLQPASVARIAQGAGA